MSTFGFTLGALYHLQVSELQDLARLIRGESYHPPRTKEALIRGVVLPFLKKATKAPDGAAKDEVMRAALVQVAKDLKVSCDDLEAAEGAWLLAQIKRQVAEEFQKRVQDLDPEAREEIQERAEKELADRAKKLGLGLVPGVGVIIGEASGFGIYLATTTGLGALSTAIGVTFPWAVYQGATTVLGVVLGPVGWVLAGSAAIAGGAGFLRQWSERRKAKLMVVVIAIVLFVGDNPYDWFGLSETDSLETVKPVYRAMIKTFHPDILHKGLPEWATGHFYELFLRTQESYDRIQGHKEEVGS